MTGDLHGGRAGPDSGGGEPLSTARPSGNHPTTTPAKTNEINSILPHDGENPHGTALEVARRLIEMGAPVFAAPPVLGDDGNWDPTGGTDGYWLPKHWQTTVPTLNWLDPAVPGFENKAWRPGWALCAVTGVKFDVIDTDPRNGGDVSRARLVDGGVLPTVYAVAATPSGGTHELIAPLGIGSKNGFLPGLDLKGGKVDATSRGFIFMAPTKRVSKVTGALGTYVWTAT